MTLLDHLISVQLCPQVLTKMSGNAAQCIEQLQAEKTRITGLLFRLSDLPAGNPRRTAAVRYWQRTITRLLDVLRCYTDAPGVHALQPHYADAAQQLLQC